MHKVIYLRRKLSKNIEKIFLLKNSSGLISHFSFLFLLLLFIFFSNSFKTAIKSVKQKTVASNQKIYVLCSFCNIYKLNIYVWLQRNTQDVIIMFYLFQHFLASRLMESTESETSTLYVCMQYTLDAYEYFQPRFSKKSNTHEY